MDIDQINELLFEAAEELREEEIAERYQEFLDEMYFLLEMEQYQRDCYDLDAEYYGAY